MTLPDETFPTPVEPSPQPEPRANSLHPTAARMKTASVKSPGRKLVSTAKKPISYADAGVDISSGDRSKQRIKMLARKTFNKHVLSEIGGFGGLFALDL
jgi:phosphoribosylformylglycinamidine cyclo-ligase